MNQYDIPGDSRFTIVVQHATTWQRINPRGISSSIVFCCALVFFGLGQIANHAFAQEQPAVLTWHNGDALDGRLDSATPSKLVWQSSLFKDDLSINITALESIAFPGKQKYRTTKERFLIQLNNGDRIFANIDHVDSDFVSVSSHRHGSQRLDRASVLGITDLENSESLEVPILENWTSIGNTKQYWTELADGRLRSTRKDISLAWETELPPTLGIELVVTWEKKLDFVFGFGVPRDKRAIESLPKIETWEESIVLFHEDDFETLFDEFDSSAKRLRLFIAWDNDKNRVKVFNELGKQLCNMQLPAKTRGVKNGIFLANKSGDLTVESLRISKNANGLNSSQLGVLTTKGNSFSGVVKGFDGNNWSVETDGKARDVPTREFSRCVLALPGSRPPVEEDSGVVIRYQDGSIVKGELLANQAGSFSIKTAYSRKPVACNQTGMAELLFATGHSASEKTRHVLYLENSRLQGELMPGTGVSGDVLRWRVVGGENAARLAQADSRIELSELQTKIIASKQPRQWPDSLCMVNRDVIPCRIIRVDENKVHFESFTESSSIAHKDVKAIVFGARQDASKFEVSESTWFFAKDTLENADLSKNQIVVRGPTSFGHNQLMSGNQLDFDLTWKRNTTGIIQLRLFVDQPEAPQGGIPLEFAIFDTEFRISERILDGQSRSAMLSIRKRKVHITLKARNRQILILVDGKPRHTIPLRNQKVTGRGVAFQVKRFENGWMDDEDIEQAKMQITLSNFVGMNNENTVFFQSVNEEKKSHALTIPRLRKQNPPKQILCSRSGDLLRGDLIELKDGKLRFKSGLDEFDFSQDVVSSIVWIHAQTETVVNQKDEKDPGATIAKNAEKQVPASDASTPSASHEQIVQLLLGQRQRITISANAWRAGKLSGVSTTLGNCQIPITQIKEMRFGSFADQATDVPFADWIAVYAKEPALVGACDTGNGGSEGSKSPLVGTLAKDFEASLVDSTSLKLSDLRGKIVVLDFWATWCGPCVQAMPEVIGSVKSFASPDVVLIAVNQGEQANTIQDFVERRKWNITPAMDADSKIGKQFNVEGIPQTVIIDGKGIIRFVHVGAAANLKETLIAEIEKARASQPENDRNNKQHHILETK